MARRKKRSHQKHSKAQGREALTRAAAEHLEHRRFKDAAAGYKALLKEERRPEWVHGLARAYAGRAEQLASRGMVKEAIALWHNRAEACGEPLADPHYLSWLLAAGRTGEAARLYNRDPEALAGEGGLARLRARLAAVALANAGELVEHLHADDPVARDFAAADAALAAYSRSDDSALEAALERIPFRSPYRDFRQLLKALLRRDQAPGAAAELLARVPVDTPFAGLRAALDAACQADHCPWPSVTTLPAEVLELVAALEGWSPGQVRLVPALARLGPSPGQHALSDFILGHRKALGEPFAREAAFAIAGNDYRLHRRLVGIYDALPMAEKQRLIAQVTEAHGDPWQAADQWQALLEALAAEPDSEDSRLRRALIHRHIAGLIQPSRAAPPLEPEAVDHLEWSLELDPADRDSNLRLIEHYLHVRNIKAARHWADQALRHHPEDAECLFKAAETAVAGGAYKKAARFAHRLLAIDPINPRVRGLLVDAYLAHARKQITAGKATAGRRELNQAGQWARSQADEARVRILHGLMTLAEEGAQAAGEPLRLASEHAGGGLVGQFYLLLEAGRLGQDLQAVTRAAALPAAKTAGDREQVLALVRAIGGLREGQQHQRAVEGALQMLAPAINQAAKINLAREEIQLVCETLLRYRRYDSLERHARAALRRWPGAPLFVFYKLQGRLAGRTPRPWAHECRQLEAAYERAYDEGDMRTAQRIQAALDAVFPLLPPLHEGDPFPNEVAPADDALGEDESLEAVLGDTDSALHGVLEAILGRSGLRRLKDALERDEPPPPDIVAKLEALNGGSGPPEPRPSRKKRKGKREKKADSYQGDLFGGAE